MAIPFCGIMNLKQLSLRLSLLIWLIGCAPTSDAIFTPNENLQESLTLFDETRMRSIAVELYFPRNALHCTTITRCPAALISPGYGVNHTHYSFIAHTLNELGYLVVAVQHELPSDAPLAKTGDLFKARAPAWQRGAENLRFTRNSLQQRYPEFDWTNLTLIGHSNGGDTSAWLLQDSSEFATTLITLDHRRVPLPLTKSLRVLSIRATDFEADVGVLPSPTEQNTLGMCISTIAHAKHNDMQDSGTEELKTNIRSRIKTFVRDKECLE